MVAFLYADAEVWVMAKPQDFSHKSQTPWLKLSTFKATFLEEGMSEQEMLKSLEELRRYNVIDTRGLGDKLEVRLNPNHLEWTAPKKINN